MSRRLPLLYDKLWSQSGQVDPGTRHTLQERTTNAVGVSGRR